MTTTESLNDIYKIISNASKPFGVNYTTLDIIKSEIDSRKLKRVDGSIIQFAREYNKTLDLIHNACEMQSKAGNDIGKIHLIFLRSYIDTVIRNINKQS